MLVNRQLYDEFVMALPTYKDKPFYPKSRRSNMLRKPVWWTPGLAHDFASWHQLLSSQPQPPQGPIDFAALAVDYSDASMFKDDNGSISSSMDDSTYMSQADMSHAYLALKAHPLLCQPSLSFLRPVVRFLSHLIMDEPAAHAILRSLIDLAAQAPTVHRNDAIYRELTTMVARVEEEAEVVTNNPIGASYEARLPNSATTDVRGVFIAISNPSGRGVDFQVTLDGLPSTGGPLTTQLQPQPDDNKWANKGRSSSYLRSFLATNTAASFGISSGRRIALERPPPLPLVSPAWSGPWATTPKRMDNYYVTYA
ncbi:hypothetical protein H2199_008901 [Coniosporium tulheliwenetii]|uniref:Uncharacterized protein n=1 Tax=Coniosporium tulheliwenetii TaxID=3383036 RepID=A0ACC2YHC3_9PEZI|nr:hypothetical protein H2199_008901 [Cladosporium sp. JES 115]